jgi:hypothetical protein
VFVSIKRLHVSVFFTTIFRGSSAVLCASRDPYLTFKISSRHYVITTTIWFQGQPCGSRSVSWFKATKGSSSRKPTLYSHFFRTSKLRLAVIFGRAKDDPFYWRVLSRGRLRTLTPTHSYGNQRLQRQFDGLLIMGIIMPETCWTVSVRQSNTILRLIVTSSWVFYLSDWRGTEPQTLKTCIRSAKVHYVAQGWSCILLSLFWNKPFNTLDSLSLGLKWLMLQKFWYL